MSGSAQYQRLPSVEAEETAQHANANSHHETITAPAAPVVEVVDSVPLQSAQELQSNTEPQPPSYAASSSSGVTSITSHDVTAAAPPSYSASRSVPVPTDDAKLPTYEEYEKLHENDEEFDTNLPEPYIMPAEYSLPREGVPAVTVVEGYEFALGDDLTFCSTFFVSFFLNWLGFLLTYIFSRTIAGKCGSTSGFGLGLIKLAFYLRAADTAKEHHAEGGGEGGHSTHSGGSSYDSSDPSMAWLVWLLILFGWFTFVRGITLYIKYKRQFALLQGDASTV